MKSILVLLVIGISMLGSAASAGEDPATLDSLSKQIEKLTKTVEGYRHKVDVLEKKIDDGLWFDHRGIQHERDDAHGLTASRALQWQALIDAGQQQGPTARGGLAESVPACRLGLRFLPCPFW